MNSMSINKILSDAIAKISMEYGVRIECIKVNYVDLEMLNGDVSCHLGSINIDAKITNPIKKQGDEQ